MTSLPVKKGSRTGGVNLVSPTLQQGLRGWLSTLRPETGRGATLALMFKVVGPLLPLLMMPSNLNSIPVNPNSDMRSAEPSSASQVACSKPQTPRPRASSLQPKPQTHSFDTQTPSESVEPPIPDPKVDLCLGSLASHGARRFPDGLEDTPVAQRLEAAVADGQIFEIPEAAKPKRVQTSSQQDVIGDRRASHQDEDRVRYGGRIRRPKKVPIMDLHCPVGLARNLVSTSEKLRVFGFGV